VVRAIEAMKSGLDSPQPLTALARSGMFSRFYFHRIFREVTAMTPARFLAALRMAEARRLLLHTTMPVTKISARVGYRSLGTFTTQFGRLVGVSPARFREVVRSLGDEPVGARLPALHAMVTRPVVTVGTRSGVTVGTRPGATVWTRPGAIMALSGAPGPESLVVGHLFHTGRSAEATLWALGIGSGPVRLPEVPGPGEYLSFSVVVPAAVRLVDALVDDVPGRCLAGGARVSFASDGQPRATVRVALRRPRTTDPPVLAITPLHWLVESTAGR
jgi:AraC family transcriptional regulator